MSIEPAKPASEPNAPTTRPTPCAIAGIGCYQRYHCILMARASVEKKIFCQLHHQFLGL